MKLIVEYMEHAAQFERMATMETDDIVKAQLLEQAAAYRKLARERAKRLNIALGEE
jgi:hypothetical protein